MDIVVLAGYLKLIPVELVRAFKRRILNIHPALLPAFGGKGYYGARVRRQHARTAILMGDGEGGQAVQRRVLLRKACAAVAEHCLLSRHCLPPTMPSFPSFATSQVHRAVVASGARFSGPTIHFVDEEYDTGGGPLLQAVWAEVFGGTAPASLPCHGTSCTYDPLRWFAAAGPILAQAVVPVFPTDSPQQLAARVLKEEHRLYPECVAAMCEGRVTWRDDGVPILWSAH